MRQRRPHILWRGRGGRTIYGAAETGRTMHGPAAPQKCRPDILSRAGASYRGPGHLIAGWGILSSAKTFIAPSRIFRRPNALAAGPGFPSDRGRDGPHPKTDLAAHTSGAHLTQGKNGTPKMQENDQKWPKKAQNDPKWLIFAESNDPKRASPQKGNFARKMAQTELKMHQSIDLDERSPFRDFQPSPQIFARHFLIFSRDFWPFLVIFAPLFGLVLGRSGQRHGQLGAAGLVAAPVVRPSPFSVRPVSGCPRQMRQHGSHCGHGLTPWRRIDSMAAINAYSCYNCL